VTATEGGGGNSAGQQIQNKMPSWRKPSRSECNQLGVWMLCKILLWNAQMMRTAAKHQECLSWSPSVFWVCSPLTLFM